MNNVLSFKNTCVFSKDHIAELVHTLRFNKVAFDESQVDLISMSWQEIQDFYSELLLFDIDFMIYKFSVTGRTESEKSQLLQYLTFLDIKYCVFKDMTLENSNEVEYVDIIKALNSLGIRVLYENMPGKDDYHNLLNYYSGLHPHRIDILFNPLNFLADDLKPLHDVFFPAKFKEKIAGIKVIDGISKNNKTSGSDSQVEEVDLLCGNTQMLELISINKARSYSGMLIFEVSQPNSQAEKDELLRKMTDFRRVLGKI